MPKIKCNVSDCRNNVENQCSLNEVKVSGGNTSEQTCCESFIKSSGATNCASCAKENSSVSCGAHDCKHNHDCNCNADSVSVNGGCSCKSSSETNCSSFCPE